MSLAQADEFMFALWVIGIAFSILPVIGVCGLIHRWIKKWEEDGK